MEQVRNPFTSQTLQNLANVLSEHEFINGGALPGRIMFDKSAFGTVDKDIFAFFDPEQNTLFLRGNGQAAIRRVKKAIKDTPNYFVAPTEQGLYHHEIGHLLDYNSNFSHTKFMSTLPDVDRAQISLYASAPNIRYGYAEAFPEATAAWFTGQQDKLSVATIEYLEGVFKP